MDGAVEWAAKTAAKAPAPADASVMVLASGNLANAYFTEPEGRASLEPIEETYPGLLTGLAAHPGIGFILVRSEALGAVALGPAGARYLDDDRVEGVDPLALFGPNAADHLRRLDGFTNVGDLLVNSSYDAELEEVAAFEELVGPTAASAVPRPARSCWPPRSLSSPTSPSWVPRRSTGSSCAGPTRSGWARDPGPGTRPWSRTATCRSPRASSGSRRCSC